MAGPGQSVQLLSGAPDIIPGAPGRVLTGDSGIRSCCWGIFRMAPWLVRLLGQTGINVITRIMGLLLMALGIEFIVTGIKALFPRTVISGTPCKRGGFTSRLRDY